MTRRLINKISYLCGGFEMKKIVFWVSVFSLALTLVCSHSFAQMGGQQKEGLGLSQMKGGQMMSRDMMDNMTEMMKQMNEMMERLSHPMHHMTVTDHKQMNDLGKIMRKMAAEMNEMATHMEKGEMDEATAKKMQERTKAINQELEDLKKKYK
jgi:methyl-accepting chemotaxis protein